MRIIAGSLGGRRIDVPSGTSVRPTSDRVREALFSILGPPSPGTRVLDAFAGAGSLGLEAISRGAESALFVDHSAASLRCVRRNIETLDLAAKTRVLRGDAISLLRRWCARGDAMHFRWVFLDPPYRSDLAARALESLGSVKARTTLLAPDARIIVEHDRRNPPANRSGSLVRNDSRRYGDTVISIYHIVVDADEPIPSLTPDQEERPA